MPKVYLSETSSYLGQNLVKHFLAEESEILKIDAVSLVSRIHIIAVDADAVHLCFVCGSG